MKRIMLMAWLTALVLPLCRTAQAQGPIAGQPYQVPPGYEAYGAGTLINYGGANYVIQGNGTMLLGTPTGANSTGPGTYPSQTAGPVFVGVSRRVGYINDAGSSYVYYDNQGTPRYYWDSSGTTQSSNGYPAEIIAGGGYRINVPDGQGGYYIRYYDNQGRGLSSYFRATDTDRTAPQFQADTARWRQRETWGTLPASPRPYSPQTQPATPRRPSAPSWMRYYNQYQNFVAGVNQYYQQFPGYGGYSGYGGSGSSGGYSGGSYRGSGGSDPKQLVVTDPGPK